MILVRAESSGPKVTFLRTVSVGTGGLVQVIEAPASPARPEVVTARLASGERGGGGSQVLGAVRTGLKERYSALSTELVTRIAAHSLALGAARCRLGGPGG